MGGEVLFSREATCFVDGERYNAFQENTLVALVRHFSSKRQRAVMFPEGYMTHQDDNNFVNSALVTAAYYAGIAAERGVDTIRAGGR